MSELFKKPSLQATVSPAGWRSIKVATQQAPVSPLIDLAKTLNVAGQAAQTYAGLQAFEYKQGVKEGEVAAASADLDEAIEGLDTAGEQLVEQGLMPRSQLFGYQKGFRKHIGQREAKSSFYTGLQGRLKEVELNPENGNYDIIDQIIQEEETNSLQRLGEAGGSQLALQGFAEFSSEIKDRFKIQATQNRDKAIQEFSDNSHIEDLNQDFGKALIQADENEIETITNDIKSRMDLLHNFNKIPRSRIVELVWNGFAKSTVENLLVEKQPDKAEKVLNAITSIDLTGEGGSIGNINREGAYIKSQTIALKKNIQQVRDAVKADVEFDANDIMAVFNAALHPIVDGPSGIESVDNASLSAVQDFLKDVGFEGDIEKEANDLLKSGTPTRLLSYTRLYYANDAKREAYSLALPKMDLAIVQRKERARASLSRNELEGVETAVREGVRRGLETKDILDSYDPSGPITDPAAKAIAARVELEEKENTWFERDESYKAYRSSLDAGFEDTLLEFYPKLKVGDVRREIDNDTPIFKDLYNKKIKEAQLELKNDPSRMDAIKTKFEEIKTEVMGNWADFVKAKKFYEEGTIVGIEQAKAKGEEFLDTLDIDEETSQEKLESIIKPISRGFFDFGAPTEEEKEAERQSRIIRNIDLNELGPNKIKDRRIAWNKADVVKNAYNKNPDNVDLINIYELMRRKWGYQNPSEYLSDRSEFELDFRETPFYTDKAALKEEVVGLFQEWNVYSKTPKAERDLDAFPIFKKWNEVFGVRDDKDILLVKDAQLNILKTQR